ncbi:MAG TPA: CPBP family intramembrane glutamic endopeptidase, partial [Flavisolibacter sp.]|nr:CPBP family intramembrane glutamic endopeptidase [Flavisolibacter sp.]
CSMLAAAGIYLNYHFEMNRMIHEARGPIQYISWFMVFLMAFAVPYTIYSYIKDKRLFSSAGFIAVILLAPALFAWKMVFNINVHFTYLSEWNEYINHIIYWPFALLIISLVLLITWKVYDPSQAFYGTSTSGFKIASYLGILLIMVPLIAAASTQPDFLAVYPKLKNLHHYPSVQAKWLYQLVYEISYGSDFLTIELFFRGFLILGFIKYAGKESILPMAVFYCAIHFGKPMAECISSFFGGIILGVITYNTRTIWGGVIVHLGIAWLMEIGGYLGNLYH